MTSALNLYAPRGWLAAIMSRGAAAHVTQEQQTTHVSFQAQAAAELVGCCVVCSTYAVTACGLTFLRHHARDTQRAAVTSTSSA